MPEIEDFRSANVRREQPAPGKFEGNYSASFAEALHEVTMNGGCDEEAGDCPEFGCWYGKIGLADLNIREDDEPVIGAIVSEDDRGFFGYQTFQTIGEFEESWEKIEKMVERFYEESNEN